MGLFAGKRMPLICIPLTGKHKVEINHEFETILSQRPDMIEWRLDFLDGISDTDYVLSIADKITEASDVPVLVTIRSEKEGGEKIPLTEDEKVDLLSRISERTRVHLLDYEVLNSPEHVRELRKRTREHGKQLILSYHNFAVTPPNTEMMEHMRLAESYGADIVKLAVMPGSKDDVLRLLEWTRQADQTLSLPIVTMAMGQIGSLSRIVGWAYGSVMTFGVGNKPSAPGQVPVKQLREMIDQMHQMVGDWK